MPCADNVERFRRTQLAASAYPDVGQIVANRGTFDMNISKRHIYITFGRYCTEQKRYQRGFKNHNLETHTNLQGLLAEIRETIKSIAAKEARSIRFNQSLKFFVPEIISRPVHHLPRHHCCRFGHLYPHQNVIVHCHL